MIWLMQLLVRFPELKNATEPVADRLLAANTGPRAMEVWHELAALEVLTPDEEGGF